MAMPRVFPRTVEILGSEPDWNADRAEGALVPQLGCRPDGLRGHLVRSCESSSNHGGVVAGTIVCGVADSTAGRDVIQFALALSRRLHQRLVLVSTQDEVGPLAGILSFSTRQHHVGSDLLRELCQEFGLDEKVELREAVGEPAHALAQIAAEEGADLIVLWSRRVGLRQHSVECRLALELEPITAIPVVIAPPQTRRRSGRRLAVV